MHINERVEGKTEWRHKDDSAFTTVSYSENGSTHPFSDPREAFSEGTKVISGYMPPCNYFVRDLHLLVYSLSESYIPAGTLPF